MTSKVLGIGVDLGGTKIAFVLADGEGRVHKQIGRPTNVKEGPASIRDRIIEAVKELREAAGSVLGGVGIGVAGQIEPGTGLVRFGPNLDWHNVPLGKELTEALEMPVVITNDVRAATWGEWVYGAGRGCDDLICMFVGTGIGGGVVMGGRMLSGCSNTAGEIGHITIDMHGPLCKCGNHGCMEALAGGWAIARRAHEAVAANPGLGVVLLDMAGGRLEDINAKIVIQAYRAGDALASQVLDEVVHALVIGSTSLANAFNPCRLIMGGGVVEGLPELVERVGEGIRKRALGAATGAVQVVRSQLGKDAGAIGAAALAMRSFAGDGA